MNNLICCQTLSVPTHTGVTIHCVVTRKNQYLSLHQTNECPHDVQTQGIYQAFLTQTFMVEICPLVNSQSLRRTCIRCRDAVITPKCLCQLSWPLASDLFRTKAITRVSIDLYNFKALRGGSSILQVISYSYEGQGQFRRKNGMLIFTASNNWIQFTQSTLLHETYKNK